MFKKNIDKILQLRNGFGAGVFFLARVVKPDEIYLLEFAAGQNFIHLGQNEEFKKFCT